MNWNRRGLTLIELMATTVVAGLLMTSLLQVITMTGRTRNLMDAAPLHKDAWKIQLTDRMQADLEQALDYSIADGALQIEGWGGWDRTNNQSIHEPARITYRVVADNIFSKYTSEKQIPSEAVTPGAAGHTSGGGGGLLVREQRDALDLGQQRPVATLMAVGVESLSLADEGNGHSAEPDMASPIDRRIQILFDSGQVLFIPLPTDSKEATGQRGGGR